MKTITVAELLQLDIFRHVSIRAGAAGLSRAVTGITTAEDPDLIQWLNGGEVLLTSLYAASVGPLPFDEYMSTLAEKDISALVIKTSPRTPEIPADIIRLGNQFRIPVMEFPPDVRFFDIVSSVMKLILDNQAQYYTELQNTLSQLLASGAREQDVLDYLVRYIPAAISLSDSEKNVSHTAQSPQFLPEKAVADRITLPIMCMGEVEGYLEAVLNHYLDENLEGLLKHAANLLAVYFLKKYYVAEVEQTYISSFLNDLFRGVLDVKQIENRAANYGWKKDDSYMVASMQLETSRNTAKLPGILVEIAHLVPKSSYYFCIQDEFLHILYHAEKVSAPAEPYEQLTDLIESLNQYITKTHTSVSLFAGISGITSDIAQLPAKIQEADDALQFGRVFHNNTVRYEDLGALRMLATYSHRENLEQIIPPAVTKLAEYDKANNTQYLETLDSLLGNNLNLSKTAKELFIHYKTMLHRMDRICEIAEISLDDRQTRLDVELGVKLYMLLPK